MKQDIQNQTAKMMQLQELLITVEECRENGQPGYTIDELDALLSAEIGASQ